MLGDTIQDASTSSGVFPAPFGATASGLALQGGTIKAEELRAGAINRVVGISLPPTVLNTDISSPAKRTDGKLSPSTTNVAEGQLLRLPADLNIDAMKLSPTAKIMAKTAQRYGFVVWDTAGAISFRAENPIGMSSNPYPELFGGRAGYNVMWGDPSKGEVPSPSTSFK